MASAPASVQTVASGDARSDVLAGLRARIGEMQGASAPVAGFPVAAAYAGLLPGGVLRHGAVYSVPRSLSLAVGLATAASEQGAWCAVVGLPDFGVEAALAAGINRERLVLVPRPESHVLAVLSALIDVVGLVIVGQGVRLSAGELSRVQARLRDRSASLIVADEWPQSEAVLRTQSVHWSGLGQGWGSLGAREVEVAVEARNQVGRQTRSLMTFDLAGRALSSAPLRHGNQRRAVPLRGVVAGGPQLGGEQDAGERSRGAYSVVSAAGGALL